MFARFSHVGSAIKTMEKLVLRHTSIPFSDQLSKRRPVISLQPVRKNVDVNINVDKFPMSRKREQQFISHKFGENYSLIHRHNFSISSDFNDPGNREGKRIGTSSQSLTSNSPFQQNNYAQQSIFGLLTSLARFLLNIIAAVLKVLFHFVRMLAGEKGERIIDDTKKSASRQAEGLKRIALGKSDDVVRGYEKTRAVVNEKIPQVKSKLDNEIPLMKRSLDEFSQRMNTEMAQAKTPKEKRRKFYEIFKDFVKSNTVYQAVTLSLLIYIIYKLVKFLFW